MTRPRIAADVAAALTAAIPPRLIKKLDAEPTLADRWTWSATAVVTDKNETVSLTLTGEVITGVACSCLLQPKCLHIAAVVTLLEPDASTAGAAAPAAAAAA
ncbi:MAG: SWIM zinc finger family protein, partial [Deltaproteobacteria bacterium]|nr:SWIM zinc finger family protein [Deltaproteobacteria bacterium]